MWDVSEYNFTWLLRALRKVYRLEIERSSSAGGTAFASPSKFVVTFPSGFSDHLQ